MRQLRTVFCAFSWIASVLALAMHLGLNLWTCASCSFVNDLPISGLLAWSGPVILSVLTYGLYKDLKWAKIGLGVAAFCSLTAMAWMIGNNTICKVCVLVHVGVLSAALALIPQPKFIGPLFFSLLIAFTATDGWLRFAAGSGVGIFRPRTNEVIPTGKVFVLFTDPECSRCQMAEQEISKLPKPPAILYRWTLLPQSMYRSIRAATVLEMARQTGPNDFERFRVEILHTTPPLTDSILISAANRAGLGKQVKEWLDNPSQPALVDIERDQATTRELSIQSLPALAELSEPNVAGTRTLRLVPLSTIGVGQ